jgi:hypothetical protein
MLEKPDDNKGEEPESPDANVEKQRRPTRLCVAGAAGQLDE